MRVSLQPVNHLAVQPQSTQQSSNCTLVLELYLAPELYQLYPSSGAEPVPLNPDATVFSPYRLIQDALQDEQQD